MRLPQCASAAVRGDAVHEVDQPAGELSYRLAPEARGRGLAYTAVRMMMASVVASAGLRSVVLDIEAGTWLPRDLRSGWARSGELRHGVEVDRTGVRRTLVVYVLAVEPA